MPEKWLPETIATWLARQSENYAKLYQLSWVGTRRVLESMGNYAELHGDKRRERMDIDDIGKEAFIHWNGPPTAKADRLRREALHDKEYLVRVGDT